MKYPAKKYVSPKLSIDKIIVVGYDKNKSEKKFLISRARLSLSLRYQMTPAFVRYFRRDPLPVSYDREIIWSSALTNAGGFVWCWRTPGGGEEKTKCLKFWKSSVEFMRKNQRRLRRDELLIPRATSPDYGFSVVLTRTSDRTASNLKSLKGPLSIPLESGYRQERLLQSFYTLRPWRIKTHGPTRSDDPQTMRITSLPMSHKLCAHVLLHPVSARERVRRIPPVPLRSQDTCFRLLAHHSKSFGW